MMYGRSIARRLGYLASLVLVTVAFLGAATADARAAPKPEPAPTDEPMTVALIDGTVVTLDVGLVGRLANAVGQPTQEGVIAALAEILNASTYPPTAVLLIAAYRLNPNLVDLIAAAAALSTRDDVQEALVLFSFESGVDWHDIVAGVQRVNDELASALAEELAMLWPQNPRPPETEPSFAQNTAENPNRISPQKPGEQDQQTQ
jgi:hypothetical protein